MELGHPSDDRVRPLEMNLRAHTAEFRGMHVAIFKHRFRDHRPSLGAGEECHYLRLHIGGEAWIRRGDKIDWSGAPHADHAYPIIPLLDADAGGAEMIEQCGEVLWPTVVDGDIAT